MGYSYTGTVKGVTLKKAGYYKLEVWGAQGSEQEKNGSKNGRVPGGFGGYSIGVINKSQNEVIYIVVGQKTGTRYGGYNGGGNSGNDNTGANGYGGGGGGATHIATRTGLLSTLSSYQSNVLIVAGGGGGSSGGNDVGGLTGSGYGNGGGYTGGVSSAYQFSTSSGGTQSSGGICGKYTGNCCSNTALGTNGGFGQGGNITTVSASGGGGGGWYGGAGGSTRYDSTMESCSCTVSGSGGSGYIGNSLLLSAKSITKQMYMHSTGCSSSSAAATKTTCTNNTGAHVANAANTGDGYARITYLGT